MAEYWCLLHCLFNMGRLHKSWGTCIPDIFFSLQHLMHDCLVCKRFWLTHLCLFKIMNQLRVIESENKTFSSNHSLRGNWLWKPANINIENNDAVVYVGSSLTVRKPLSLFTNCDWINSWHVSIGQKVQNGAYSNPVTQVGACYKDFDTISQMDLTRV